MEGSVLSFLKAEWKVSDTGSAHWASSSYCFFRSLVSSGFTFLFNGFPGMAPALYCKKAMTTVFWSDKMFRINDDC